MMMLPEPTEVMPTKNPASSPMADIPTNDFMVGGRARRALQFVFEIIKKLERTISKIPTAIVMK